MDELKVQLADLQRALDSSKAEARQLQEQLDGAARQGGDLSG